MTYRGGVRRWKTQAGGCDVSTHQLKIQLNIALKVFPLCTEGSAPAPAAHEQALQRIISSTKWKATPLLSFPRPAEDVGELPGDVVMKGTDVAVQVFDVQNIAELAQLGQTITFGLIIL
jgi:hypothetical protein